MEKKTYKFTPMFLLIWDMTSKVRTEKNLHTKERRQYVEVYQKLKYQQKWRLASGVGRKAHITSNGNLFIGRRLYQLSK